MNETWRIFEYPDSFLHQPSVVCLSKVEDSLLVRIMRCDDSYIDSTLGGDGEGNDHLIVKNKIWCGYPDIAICTVYHLNIGILAHIVVIQRTVSKWLDKPIICICRSRQESADVDHRLYVLHAECRQLYEHESVVPDARSFKHNDGILPMPESDASVYVFIGEVDSSVEGDVTINDADLAVVTVVETGRETRMQGIELACMDSIAFQHPV